MDDNNVAGVPCFRIQPVLQCHEFASKISRDETVYTKLQGGNCHTAYRYVATGNGFGNPNFQSLVLLYYLEVIENTQVRVLL